MSGRVDVNIDELEKFAHQLKDFNNQLEQITDKIQGQIQNLGDTWRDEQYAKFVEEWYSTFRSVDRYLNISPDYVRHLLIMAHKLRDAYGG